MVKSTNHIGIPKMDTRQWDAMGGRGLLHFSLSSPGLREDDDRN
jgi:hypothetical protein